MYFSEVFEVLLVCLCSGQDVLKEYVPLWLLQHEDEVGAQ